MASATDKVYRELQQHLNDLPAGFPATQSGVEIRILRQLFSPVEAAIALKLGLIPATFGRIHRHMKRSRLSKSDLQRNLDTMVAKGIIGRIQKGKLILFRIIKFMIGIYEFQVNRLTPEFMADMNQYVNEALASDFLQKGGVTQIRTIPVEQSIPYLNYIYRYDDIRALIDHAKGHIAVAPCVCRLGHDFLGQRCQLTDLRESCFTFGAAADYWIRQGYARKIPKEEALAILQQAQDAGLLLQPGNVQRLNFVCTCCGCCCEALKILKTTHRPFDFYNTNYFAEVEPVLCRGCQTCVKRCQMGALTVENRVVTVNRNLCLGCGQCVATCPTHAMHLRAKPRAPQPPKNGTALNLGLIVQRSGKWAALKSLLKMIVKIGV